MTDKWVDFIVVLSVSLKYNFKELLLLPFIIPYIRRDDLVINTLFQSISPGPENIFIWDYSIF